jgi:hypothetical protein
MTGRARHAARALAEKPRALASATRRATGAARQALTVHAIVVCRARGTADGVVRCPYW